MSRPRHRAPLAAFALGCVATACRPAAPPPATPRPRPTEGEDPGGAVNEWQSMDFLTRHTRMTFTVLPVLAKRFQRFEGADVATLNCYTCHGDDAETVDWRMPNGLAAVDPNEIEPGTERMVRFMEQTVVPAANRTMTGGGSITCASCHPNKG